MTFNPLIKYRKDIDGLRAIAVLSVIIFHIHSKWIPGGFLGVDIFFVISGYLITLILTKEVSQTNNINIVNFYKRRIKRIIPALLFVLIPVFIVGFLIMSPEQLLSLSKSMIWSFFSAANIYFYAAINSGYFATVSSEFPLLHLWSLGVEEQFYLVWPFVVFIMLRYIPIVKKQLLLVGIVLMASLILAQLFIFEHQSFTYYMLPTRAWELLAGASIAFLVHAKFRVSNSTNEVMAALGLVVIMLSFIFVSKLDPVPGIAGIPVIIGTMLLLVSGIHSQTYVGRLLSFKFFVAVGLLSYSAYLWHWPILAFLRYSLVEINITIAIAVMVATFILATISYFFIETPLRKNDVNTKNVFLYYFLLPAIIIVGVSFVTIQGIKNKSSWVFPWERLNTEINASTLPAYAYEYNCQYASFHKNVYTQERCVYPKNTAKADVFLIGDSNGAHYLGMLRVFAKQYGFSIRNATQDSCPMVFNSDFEWVNPKYKKGCALYTHSIEDEAKKYNTVVVGGMWNGYYRKEGFKDSFEQTIETLAKNTKHVILLGKVPLFSGYNKDCDSKATRLTSLHCAQRFNNTLADNPSNTLMRKIADTYDNVEYFGVRNIVCQGKVCSPYIDKTPVYYNSGHLSMEGSRAIGEKMLEVNDSMLDVFNHLHR